MNMLTILAAIAIAAAIYFAFTYQSDWDKCAELATKQYGAEMVLQACGRQ